MSDVAAETATYGLKPTAYIVVPAICVVFATIALSLRIYVRAIMIKSFGLDDWALLVAFVIYIGTIATTIQEGILIRRYGIVKPLLVVSAWDLSSMLLYLFDQIFVKLSLALFILRIPQDRWQVWTIRISFAIYAAFSTAFFFVVLFMCGKPSSFNFIFGKCMSWDSIGPLNYIAASLNAVIDWILVFSPMFVVYQTTMRRRLKIQVCSVIALGALGSVVSVARIPRVYHLKTIPSFTFFGRIVDIILLSIVESSFGIIAISLAALKPLLQRAGRYPATEGHSRALNTYRPTNQITSLGPVHEQMAERSTSITFVRVSPGKSSEAHGHEHTLD